jgi:hypothetical protein
MSNVVVRANGAACVREKDGWWNVSILLDVATRPITCPSFRTEIEAKNFVSVNYPNCDHFMSSADMFTEVEARRQERAWRDY